MIRPCQRDCRGSPGGVGRARCATGAEVEAVDGGRQWLPARCSSRREAMLSGKMMAK